MKPSQPLESKSVKSMQYIFSTGEHITALKAALLPDNIEDEYRDSATQNYVGLLNAIIDQRNHTTDGIKSFFLRNKTESLEAGEHDIANTWGEAAEAITTLVKHVNNSNKTETLAEMLGREIEKYNNPSNSPNPTATRNMLQKDHKEQHTL